MEIKLVEATTQDAPRLREWMRKLRRVDPMATESLVPEHTSQAAMEQLLGDASLGTIWIIQVDQKSAGYVAVILSFSIEFGGHTAFIDELFIEEAYRDKGVGRRVVELVIESAARLGVRNLLLEVSEENHAARRLYERCGFADRKYRLMSKWIGEAS